MLEDECVGLGLESKGVIFDFGWEESNAVVLLSYAPNGCRLDSINDLEKGLGGGREVCGHCCRVVGLPVFCCCE